MIKLSVVDYLIDLFFYADIYLKWNRFGFEQYGENVTNLTEIRRRYKSGWLRIDCLSMLPAFYCGDYFGMTIARLLQLLKSPQLLEDIQEIESLIREQFMKGSTTMLSVFDLIKFLVFFLSAAHHVGSTYFLLGRMLTSYNLSAFSWMTVDPTINANPDSALVQYNRAIYWCLETFTVVCFGDVLARNAPETVFASFTCIIGWMCIGQVVGRITSLMASIDLDSKEHNVRVDNFEQYARNRRLPRFLRERAVESVEYKSKCLIELKMWPIFNDLPLALHVTLFEELYGDIIRGVPAFVEMCSGSQIRVLANAFELEIYVEDDIIIEEGRLGKKLFIMKEGRAEYLSVHSRMVFAGIHEGMLFGELAFFLPGTRQFASVRASKSCQVLQLTRLKWNSLWPDETRRYLESKIMPTMRNEYHSVSLAYLNIVNNLELSIHTGPISTDSRMKSGPSNYAQNAPLSPCQERGSSFGSVQSGATSGGILEAEEFDHDNSTATTPASEKVDQSTCKGSIKAASRSLSPLARRLLKKRKWKTRSGGPQRKLGDVLGLEIAHHHRSVHPKQPESAGWQWKRYEKNLRVLKLIDARIQQTRNASQARATRSNSLDVTSRVDGGSQSPPATTSSPSNQSGPQVSDLPVDPTSGTDSIRGGEIVKNVHRPFKRDREVSSSGAKHRHSIQLDRADLNLAFRATVDSVDRPRNKPPTQNAREGRTSTPSDAVVTTNKHQAASAFARVVASVQQLQANQQLHAKPIVQEPVQDPSEHSMASSARSADSEESEASPFAQHLETLKLRAMRRQRSVFADFKHSVSAFDMLRNPYEIWFEPPMPPSFCLESSSFRRKWSTLMYFICLYYILVVPFRVSFDFDYLSSPEATTMMAVWFAVEYVMDALCVIDFVLHRNYFTFVHRGALVTDKRAIRLHYIREGTYVVDLLCIIPLELLIPVSTFLSPIPGSTSNFTWYRIAAFRLNKMLRIAHLHLLGDKLQRMLMYDMTSLSSYLRPSFIYFVRFAFDFALGAHWVACFFYGASFNTFTQGEASWLTTAGMLTFKGIETEEDVGHVSLVMKYARSYHFSMGAITTVSYGDIAAQNAWRRSSGRL